MTFTEAFGKDAAAESAGILIDTVGDGKARARLTVTNAHLNGLGSAHGGIIFLLADAAFAQACNSRGTRTVAASCSISYSAAPQPGDVLTAECTETHLQGRSGVYDVTVTNQHGSAIAHFRGNSIALR